MVERLRPLLTLANNNDATYQTLLDLCEYDGICVTAEENKNLGGINVFDDMGRRIGWFRHLTLFHGEPKKPWTNQVCSFHRWCAACGQRRVLDGTCEPCRNKPRLEDHACGVCGERADVMFVYGFRCETHKHVWNPSQMIQGPGIVGCVGRAYRPPVPDPRLAYYEMIVERGGGIITLPEYLGVFVSATENAGQTPAGWLFVPIEGLTAEQLKLWVDEVRTTGRKNWPEKEIPVKPVKPDKKKQ